MGVSVRVASLRELLYRFTFGCGVSYVLYISFLIGKSNFLLVANVRHLVLSLSSGFLWESDQIEYYAPTRQTCNRMLTDQCFIIESAVDLVMGRGSWRVVLVWIDVDNCHGWSL